MELCDARHVLDWDTLMDMSKIELLELYKEKKQEGVVVYFKGSGRYEGYWRLDNKGDVILIRD